ncbi:DUF4197 domain-containing protein [Zeaxanthinibacter sp. PT1]|uniref:DUF4197 domain-containing protein n=1 Tax=Zeaxanthinibacter TaxID=561554 RepID=UPI00234BD55D|nr:DUF4197 domain-containing protein [Zeaxanthinibacter sp. PT1]MDC6352463.1 DUF4197 domain-containing protein [Zeaxanthinibacter sp. PT1]
MFRKLVMICLLVTCSSCAELQGVVNQLPGGGLTDEQIAAGLQQALQQGIDQQVSTLALEDGFYKNELVKILLPEELQKVDRALRDIGLGHLADEGLLLLNRAAEDAVSEATPVFINAVKGITFQDARNILLGDEMAATQYLKSATNEALYDKFEPVIQTSLKKVRASEVWERLITRYNSLPLTQDVNPDLTDYVTREALSGVYTMIAIEEKEIRNQISARTTELLRRVFALQDNS